MKFRIKNLFSMFLVLVLVVNVGAQANLDSQSDGIEDAFAALQDFAKDSADIGDNPTAARLDAAINAHLEPLENSGVELEKMSETDSANTLKQVASLSTKDVLDEDLIISPSILPTILMLGGIKSTKKMLGRIVESLLIPSDRRRIVLTITGNPIPKIGVTSEDLRQKKINALDEEIERVANATGIVPGALEVLKKKRKEAQEMEALSILSLELSVGLLSMVKNVDELAGVIAQAMSRFNPYVYGLSDDPRIYRNLEAISGFKDLEPKFQEIIKSDAAAIERLVAAGFNPWAIYNFETNALDFLNEKFIRQGRYAPITILRSRDLAKAVEDELRPVRIQAMKAYITYFSKQKDILANVRHDEKFSAGFKFLQYRLKVYTQSFFSRLTFAAPVVGGVLSFSSMESIIDAVASVYVSTKGLLPEKFWDTGEETIGESVSSAKESVKDLAPETGAPSWGIEFPDLTPLVDVSKNAINEVVDFVDPTDFIQKYSSYLIPVRDFVVNFSDTVWARIENAETQDAVIFVTGMTAAVTTAVIYRYRNQILSFISGRIDSHKNKMQADISESKKLKMRELKKKAVIPEKIVVSYFEDKEGVVLDTDVPTPAPTSPTIQKFDWDGFFELIAAEIKNKSEAVARGGMATVDAGKKVATIAKVAATTIGQSTVSVSKYAGTKVMNGVRQTTNGVVATGTGIYNVVSYVVLGVSGYAVRKAPQVYHGALALGPKVVRKTKSTAKLGWALTVYLANGSVNVTLKSASWGGRKLYGFVIGSFSLASTIAVTSLSLGKDFVFWVGRQGRAAIVTAYSLMGVAAAKVVDTIDARRRHRNELDLINSFILRGESPEHLEKLLSSLVSYYISGPKVGGDLLNLRLRDYGTRGYIGQVIGKWNQMILDNKVSLEQSKQIFAHSVIGRLPVELLRDAYVQSQLTDVIESLESKYENAFEEIRNLTPGSRLSRMTFGIHKIYSGQLSKLTVAERRDIFENLLEMKMNSQFKQHLRQEIPNLLVDVLATPQLTTNDWVRLMQLGEYVDYKINVYDERVWSRLNATQKIQWHVFTNDASPPGLAEAYKEYVSRFKTMNELLANARENFDFDKKHLRAALQSAILLHPKFLNTIEDILEFLSLAHDTYFSDIAYAPSFLKIHKILTDFFATSDSPFRNRDDLQRLQRFAENHAKLNAAIVKKDARAFAGTLVSIHSDSAHFAYDYTHENADWIFKQLMGDPGTTQEEFKEFWRYAGAYRRGDRQGGSLRGDIIFWGKQLAPEAKRRWEIFSASVGVGKKLHPEDRILKHLKLEPKTVRDLIAILNNYSKWMYKEMAPTLHSFILSRPELIQSREDIETFIKFDAFWPETEFWSAGDLEKPLMAYFDKMKRDHGAVWKYEPSMVERAHHFIGERMRALGIYPKDLGGRFELFKLLTDRGVSSLSDEILHGLLAEADAAREQQLQTYAVNQGRIFEQGIQEEFAVRSVKASAEYRSLVSGNIKGEERTKLLEKVVELLQTRLPSGGLKYVNFLEELSVEILSTQEESQKIHAWKIFPNGRTAQSSDSTYSAISRVFDSVIHWKKHEQFEFLLFLRGDIEPTRLIRKSFPTIGPERIRRMYQSLPLPARMAILDMFMENGLLKGEKLNKGIGLKVVEHLIGEGNSEAQQVARQLLVAFLYALKEVNASNTALQKTILSYLYAMPKTLENSIGHTLKQILEVFGATGIKVGQFLVAAKILPENETKILRDLQEKADIPMREDMFADAREILGTQELPFVLKQLLGAASLKYAYLATEIKTQREVVIKVFRAGSVNHVRTQFALLEKMTEYLIKHHGVKYGLFRSIVNASRRAVEKETEISKEASKSKRARNFVYINLDEPGMKVEVPKEALIKDRMLVSEFARGTSFYALPDNLKRVAAKKILEVENKILFSEQDEIEFDPDRHAGNYRIYFKAFEGKDYLVLEPVTENDETGELSPIDFGQFISIKKADREKVIKLFAISQIVTRLGVSSSISQQISEIFALTQTQSKKLEKSLRRYFPDPSLKEVTPYFALIAAVEETGHEVDIAYSDFIRAIVQLVQYEQFMPQGTQTPSANLEKQVRAMVKSYLKNTELSSSQKVKIAAYNAWERLRTTFSGADYRPIILDTDSAENFQLTRELKMGPNGGSSTPVTPVTASKDVTLRMPVPHLPLSCEGLF